MDEKTVIEEPMQVDVKPTIEVPNPDPEEVIDLCKLRTSFYAPLQALPDLLFLKRIHHPAVNASIDPRRPPDHRLPSSGACSTMYGKSRGGSGMKRRARWARWEQWIRCIVSGRGSDA